jgi:hypothetical protein
MALDGVGRHVVVIAELERRGQQRDQRQRDCDAGEDDQLPAVAPANHTYHTRIVTVPWTVVTVAVPVGTSPGWAWPAAPWGVST